MSNEPELRELLKDHPCRDRLDDPMTYMLVASAWDLAWQARKEVDSELLWKGNIELARLRAEVRWLRGQLAGAEEQNRSLQELLDEANRKLEAVDAFDSIDSPSDRGDV